ncbi:M1 family aminopeptidase [Flavicella sp.]|uniref:M1 family aminopeptidase n=1 Tax=Flavicella sp. TaxID=2957742 RepID=UPI003017EA29
MRKIGLFFVFLSVFTSVGYTQNSKITIKAILLPDVDQMAIQQKINYVNKSGTTLQNIVLHNWPNSFKNKKTLLAKRMLENFKKSLYFSDSIERGNSDIRRVSVNFSPVKYQKYKGFEDILEVLLKQPLLPLDSLTITINYKIKFPSNKFTGYGKNSLNDYILRYWYLVPAVCEKGDWKAYSNLDIDHMYMNVIDYDLNVHVPITYHINTDLYSSKSYSKNFAIYHLTGKNRVDIQLNITREKSYPSYKTDHIVVVSNIDDKTLPHILKKTVINREIKFIEKYLGKFPHNKLLIDKETAYKNRAYALDIPKFLSGFSDVFQWDIEFFKALSKKMVEEMVIVNKNEDYWLPEGIQVYLLMKYCEEFYPETKILGNLSNIWGLKTFNITQLKFNDKYPFIYQFSARENLDQSLMTRVDSLSNFNRKIISSYKAGLGLRYLENFLEDTTFQKSLKQYIKEYKFKTNSTHLFQEIITSNTTKNISWFFGDYLNTIKKIDYTIKKVKVKGDSVYITIKNTRNITAPVALYGIKDKKIIWKQWITDVDSTKTVKVAKGNFDKISINYEKLYPELNQRNNWKNVKSKLFERPLQLKFIKDIDDPYYTQIFFKPRIGYNYYDGMVLGIQFHNKTFLAKYFEYNIIPTYSFKSNNISGGFSFNYNHYPEDRNIYKLSFGINGSSFNYDRDYTYTTFKPSATIYFNRKSLRTAGRNFLKIKYHNINKKIPLGVEPSNEDKYNLVKITYNYSKPELLNDFRFSTSAELGSLFHKISTDFRYRKLTKSNRQLDFRWYTGVFLENSTDDDADYFSFGLSKPQDYLFEHNMYGRQEDAGFLYQQYIIAEGGFKSFFKDSNQKYANQWMSTINTSFSIWNWAEIYNDIGALKSKNKSIFFAYESGIRLCFMHEIFELYLPVYSNNGWEMNQNYSEKIRFTFILEPLKIFNSMRRGFL